MKPKSFYPPGKLPLEKLETLLKQNKAFAPEIVVGPGIGRDAAVIDFGEKYLVAKTDPITFVTDEIGYYAVNINANDIACTGARPGWFLVTVLLPEGKTDEALVDSIFQQISAACRDLCIGLAGGHTEITAGIDRPLIVGQMLGEVEKDRLVKPERIEIGDLVILSKGIAIEAVSILAREKEEELAKKFGSLFVEKSRNFLFEPGISVLEDAMIAAETVPVHAFHDPTEGGLSGGLYELARAGLVGLAIDKNRIPIFPATEKFCDYFHIDPFGVIASGALLIVTTAVDADSVAGALQKNKISAEIIGEVISPENGVLLLNGNQSEPFPKFDRDEITKIL